MKWYIVQAHAGAEKKVSEQIKEELIKVDQESKFGEALVPTQDVTEIKKGKRSIIKKKYFPGYILVKLDMTNEIYHLIKSLKKVSGFLGPQGKPSPISEEEVKKLLEIWRKVLQTHHHQLPSKLESKLKYAMDRLPHLMVLLKKLMKKNLDLRYQFLYLVDPHL